MQLLIFLLAVFLAFHAHALDFSEETSAGSSIFQQNVMGEGELGGTENQDPPWNWGLSYTFEQSVTPNPGGDPIIDNSNDVTGTMGWNGDSGWGASVTLEYSNTPAESLVDRGGSFSGSYQWSYAKPQNPDDFSPYLTFKINLGTTNYLESYNGSVRRKKKTVLVSGTSELRSQVAGPELIWRPVEKWKFDAGTDFYGYNRDVATFQNQLDSPAALQRGMNGFSDTVGGLPKVTYNAIVTWYFVTDWKAALSESFSIIAVDGSTSTTTKATVENRINHHWRAHVGVEYLDSNTLIDTLAIAGFEYDI